MKLRFYGSDGIVTETDKHSCFSVSSDDPNREDFFLFDAGSPSIISNENVDITSIFLTHPHLDHVKNIYTLLLFLENSGRKEDLDIFSPVNLRDHISKEITTDVENNVNFRFKFKKEVPKKFNRLNLNYLETEQKTCPPVPLYLYKISDKDMSIGYVTDTNLTPEIKDFFDGVDILITEASVSFKNEHLGIHGLKELIKNTEPEKVILTHFSEPNPEKLKEEIEHHDVVCASDGMKFKL